MKNVILIPPAEHEMINSAQYYENQIKNLGYEFLIEIQQSVKFISAFPLTWPIIDNEIRRCLVNRFPFGIYYIVVNEQVLVIAIANLHRKPDYWKKRLKKI